MPRHQKSRRVRKGVKYLRQQRGGSGALARAVSSGLRGLIKSVRMLRGFKGITPTPAVAEKICKLMYIIKRPVREARKLFPYRPDLPPGARREWSKYLTKQFYASQAAEMVVKAVDESIPIWQRVFQRPIIP